jgi:hypothetical protein
MRTISQKYILFLVIVLLTVSCHDNSTNPPNNIDIGSAKDYFALKEGNWWSYTTSSFPSNQVPYKISSYSSRITIGDTSRHQDGSLIYQYSLYVAARVPYTIIYYYAVTDSGISQYYGIQDSIYINGQWISTKYPKVPILIDPISVGRTWVVQNSNSQDIYKIVSISQQIIYGISRPLICLVHLTSSNIDTSWYAKDIGLIYIHSYILGVTPLQGTTKILDSCLVQ